MGARWYTLLAAGLAAAGAGAGPPPGFEPLFDGKSLAGLTPVCRDADGGSAWRVDRNCLVCAGGKVRGYLYTRRQYSNYHLRFEWRYPRPAALKEDAAFAGDSGVLLHIQPEHKVWPKAVVVQGMNRDYGRVFGLGVEFKAEPIDKAARTKALKPVGQWNLTEVLSRGGRITVRLNGVPVSRGRGPLTSGAVGWQCEGSEVHYRRLWIKVLK